MSEYIDVDKMLENLQFVRDQYCLMNIVCKEYFTKHSNEGDIYCGWHLWGDNGVCIEYTYQDYYYNTDLITEEGEMFVTFKELMESYNVRN